MEIENLLNFYKNKRVLVTGHTGFKGAWLSIWLQKLGAKVIGYSLDPLYEEGIFNLSNLKDIIIDTRNEIRNLKNLIKVIDAEKPEILFHLAAQPIVLDSYKEPLDTFEINIQGTANVLEAIRLTNSIQTAVFITSDKCYENKEMIWGYREIDSLGGFDPYSASKGAAEIVISSYRNSFFKAKDIGIASARAGNVIGGGDWSKYRLIPDIIQAIRNNKEILVRNPESTRPWQHVLEPLSGYLLLGFKLNLLPQEYSDAWNFGPNLNDIYSVKDVVEEILKYSKRGQWKDDSNQKKLHEANLLKLDISKAITKLKWKPVLSFDECIKLTVDWYFQANSTNALNYTYKQINYFEKKWISQKRD